MLTSWNIVQDTTNLESHLSFSFPGKQRKSSRGGYFSSPALLGAWINLYYFWISVAFIIRSLPLQEFSILTMHDNTTGHTRSFIPSQWGCTLTSRSPHALPVHFLSIQSSSSSQQTVVKFSVWISDMREEVKWIVVRFLSSACSESTGNPPRVTLQVFSEFTLIWRKLLSASEPESPYPKRKQFGPDGLKGIFSSAVLWACGANSKEQSGKRVPWELSGENGCF